ncbi:MAG: protein-tyrosine-phosphatase [Planctomycetales bacterium]|nr:protein-tyrosine-phosphatase [Planctomycetales bacterium]
MSESEAEKRSLYPTTAEFIQARQAEYAQIPAARRAELEQLADYVRVCLAANRPARLTFVCTHNSRRSHLAHIWAQVAAYIYRLDNVECYSGGTEVTALNPRAVESLRRAGFSIEGDDAHAANPHYTIRYSEAGNAIVAFSKRFLDPPNPATQFAAIMTCSHADENCPAVVGCDGRFAIRYEDPKAADDTPLEAPTYDERSCQICREMLYAMQKAAN